MEIDGTLSSVWDQASVLSNSACSIEHSSRVKESADGLEGPSFGTVLTIKENYHDS